MADFGISSFSQPGVNGQDTSAFGAAFSQSIQQQAAAKAEQPQLTHVSTDEHGVPWGLFEHADGYAVWSRLDHSV